MDFVIPDQVIDRTKGVRPFTFFEAGAVGHVGFADPFDAGLAQVIQTCAAHMQGEGIVLHKGGTVICMGKLDFSISPLSRDYIILSYQLRHHCHFQKVLSSLLGLSPTCIDHGAAP